MRSKTSNRLVTSSCLDSYPESGGCEPLTTYGRYGLERKGLMEIETIKKGRLGWNWEENPRNTQKNHTKMIQVIQFLNDSNFKIWNLYFEPKEILKCKAEEQI